MLTRLLQTLAALTLVLSVGCAPSLLAQTPMGSPSSASVPDTSAQQALVRQYLDLVAAERYAEAWRRSGRTTPRPAP